METPSEPQSEKNLSPRNNLRFGIVLLTFIFAFVAVDVLYDRPVGFFLILGFPLGLYVVHYDPALQPLAYILSRFPNNSISLLPWGIVTGWLFYVLISWPILISKNRHIYRIFYAILVIVLIFNVRGCASMFSEF